MKKALLVSSLVMATMILASCYRQQYEEQAQRNDSLASLLASKNSELDSLFTTLNQIEENLASINTRYNQVQELRRGTSESNSGIGSPADIRAQISDHIANIEQLLAANKQKMASLQAAASQRPKENARLTELINRQEERIEAQEAKIAELLTELENNKLLIDQLNKNVSDLTAANKEKDQTIKQQAAEANRCYYVVDTYAHLRENGIAEKRGGIIGLGSTIATNPEMLMEYFTEIDRAKVTTIPVNMKKVQVISCHPSNSYELIADENDNRTVAFLRILNPSKFWEQTRYLVIKGK